MSELALKGVELKTKLNLAQTIDESGSFKIDWGKLWLPFCDRLSLTCLFISPDNIVQTLNYS